MRVVFLVAWLVLAVSPVGAAPTVTVTATHDLQGNWVGVRGAGGGAWVEVADHTPVTVSFPPEGVAPSATYDIRVEHRGWLFCYASERARFMPGAGDDLPPFRLVRTSLSVSGLSGLVIAAAALLLRRRRAAPSSRPSDEGSPLLPPLAGRTIVSEHGRHFEVQELLGRGSMGAVFAAADPAWVVKAPLRRVYDDPGSRARVLEEARVGASLPLPGLVQVFDWGTFDGDWPFIVMERMTGRTLRAVLEAGAVDEPASRRWLAELARTLAALHERGIAHRDLKPENVWITPTGHAKAGDFGVAGAAESAGGGGTFLYQPPELFVGTGPVDGRAGDIFALGVIAGELLTGTPPYGGERGVGLLRLKISAAPYHMGGPLADLIADMTALQPAQRPSAEDVCARLS